MALTAAFSVQVAHADTYPVSVEAPEQTPGQAHITADTMSGEMSNTLKARGNVVVTRDDQRLDADWLDYYQAKNSVKAGDHFVLTRRHDTVKGTLLDYNLDSRTGTGLEPKFASGEPGKTMHGDGTKVDFLGKDNYRVYQSEATTCSEDDDSWYLRSSKLDLNYNTGVGTATNAHVVFKGVPIFYTPWMDFSLDDKRKSGFLYPTLKGGSNGTELALPYYWNIAPNYDATLTSHLNLRHGYMLGTEFRYLQPDYSGWIYTEQLPKDQTTGSYRYLWSANHTQTLAPNLSAGVDGITVSDADYFNDFGDRYSVAANVNLLREAWANYDTSWTGGSANAHLLVQRYQTLQAVGSTVTPPYARLPDLTVSATQSLPLGLVANLQTDATQFSHPTQQEGSRFVAYPSISLPYQRSWGYITPKLGFNYTQYQLSGDNGFNSATVTRSLPIVSLDSGLYFDRPSSLFGSDLTQTLEPRLYYLNIPTRNQSNIPNFDTSQNDFGFAQMFSENTFSGYDKIDGANDLTGALTTRLIDNDSGREVLRAAVGQRYYFNTQEVNLDGTLKDRGMGRSDFLASLGGEIVKNWSLDSLYQYSFTTREATQYNASLTYQPQAGKVVSLRYRFDANDQENSQGQIENLHSLDFGVQWPIARKWYMLMRTNYSLQDRQALDKLLGVEYNSGCWILRLVGETYITNLTQTKNSIFLQLELKGLGSMGSSPLETLRLAIPGYTKTSDIQP